MPERQMVERLSESTPLLPKKSWAVRLFDNLPLERVSASGETGRRTASGRKRQSINGPALQTLAGSAISMTGFGRVRSMRTDGRARVENALGG
jgi:hypothetical protein